ncbi:type IV pili twitching motility protein PilT [Candidatus Gottesmanbacteria bacterium RIFCSPHIGHO2_01_FULL_39_10]|uniref:Type IV pili twitching motility protein PilT n=1 Tax=Candidatus Gottesmanbacteria bacterium RIFCSPHIGHO2_01_FULL_39_10 TaxID=1798375 RepID=A0A1F5ZQ45_9BACT|nr:MAG: type IV pili twitching motility protein PilT [Candidatus Gottesmanbacteria bacterium RIFCSPHIGHO2_01_FULL_39_10]
MEMEKLLQMIVDRQASDLHLLPAFPPVLRINGVLHPLVTLSVLDKNSIADLIFSLLTAEQKELLLTNRELDFSCYIKNGESSSSHRFRVNAYFQKDSLSASFRYILPVIRTLEELGLPKILHEFTKLRQGFVLLTGPTGQGKSTTLASIINEINKTRAEHIITIEDPIEYVYPVARSIVSQRELRSDTHSWEIALRSVLREDPDVILIGEMRDYETISAALTIAEAGHLVFSTLHTNSAAQTIDRIIDVFPSYQQTQVRLQLSMVLGGVVCQKLLPSTAGGRVPAMEVLIATPSVRNTIREAKTHLIDNILQTSKEAGMFTFENYLRELVRNGKITEDIAKEYALRPQELMRLLHGA